MLPPPPPPLLPPCFSDSHCASYMPWNLHLVGRTKVDSWIYFLALSSSPSVSGPAPCATAKSSNLSRQPSPAWSDLTKLQRGSLTVRADPANGVY